MPWAATTQRADSDKPFVLNGFINIDKPAGVSSFDATRIAARALGVKTAGHAGTLDRFATGVLPIAVGEATKAIRYLHFADKTYMATALVGVVTDTLDMTGKVNSRMDVDRPADEVLREALASFVGVYDQIPPVYSALKCGGMRLSDLARAGEAVEPKARPVKIFALSLVECRWPQIVFEVRCGAGTYIRALARDIGVRLGAFGASLSELRRTQYGPFKADRSVSPDAAQPGMLLPVVNALGGIQTAGVSAAGELYIRQGRTLSEAFFSSEQITASGGRIALLDQAGRLVAVAAQTPDGWEYERVFDENR